MQSLLVRNKSLKWYDILHQIEDSRNSSYHSVIGASPNQVYDNVVNNQEIIDRNKKNAKETLEKYKLTKFAVGDKVFVSMSAYYSSVRMKIKAHKSKEIIYKYVPLILEISKVIKPSDTVVERERYELREAYHPYRTVCNEQLKNGRKQYTASRVYSSDLIRCTIEGNRLSSSMSQALYMNGCKKTQLNDLVLKDLN